MDIRNPPGARPGVYDIHRRTTTPEKHIYSYHVIGRAEAAIGERSVTVA
jgi:hypothetical protein